MIYFAQIKTGQIKIGFTRNLKNRLQSLQVGNPHKIDLLLVLEGNISQEATLHRLFQKHKCDGGGEWYEPNEGILDFINRNKKRDIFDMSLLSE